MPDNKQPPETQPASQMEMLSGYVNTLAELVRKYKKDINELNMGLQSQAVYLDMLTKYLQEKFNVSEKQFESEMKQIMEAQQWEKTSRVPGENSRPN